LLDKLEFYGTDGRFKTMIESYLQGRYKTVTQGNAIVNLPNGKK
jgi:hypothetical protein